MSDSAVSIPATVARPRCDVEAPLSIDNAYDVFDAMCEARNRWRNIGGAFRVPDSTLSCIAQEENSAEDKLYRVIKAWLEHGGRTSTCTWAEVAKTLREKTVGRDDIAREVEEKYLNQMPQSSTTSSQNVAVHFPSQDEASAHVVSQQGSDTVCIPPPHCFAMLCYPILFSSLLPLPLHPCSPNMSHCTNDILKGLGAPEIPSLSGSSHDPIPVSPQPSQSEASVHDDVNPALEERAG